MWCVPVAAQPRAHNPAAPTTAGSICKLIYRAQGWSCSTGHAGEASSPSQSHGLSVQAPSMNVAVAPGSLSCGLPRAWWAAKLAGMKLHWLFLDHPFALVKIVSPQGAEFWSCCVGKEIRKKNHPKSRFFKPCWERSQSSSFQSQPSQPVHRQATGQHATCLEAGKGQEQACPKGWTQWQEGRWRRFEHNRQVHAGGTWVRSAKVVSENFFKCQYWS